MPRDWLWRACFAICAVLLVAPLWVVALPPLVDLPQHAAQLAIGVHWHDQTFPYRDAFAFDYLANAIVPDAVTYVLALVLPVVTAYKLVLSLAVVAVPVVLARILAAVGGPRWAVFAAFPATYGYAFMWGFTSFVIAVPFGLILLLAAIRYRSEPTRRRAFVLAGAAVLVFACHVLVLACTGLAALAIVLAAPTMRARLAGAAALSFSAMLTIAWWIALTRSSPDTTPRSVSTVLGYGVARIPTLFASVVGREHATPLVIGAGMLVLFSPVALGVRLTRTWWRWAPLATGLVCYFLVPLDVLTVAFLYPRFAVFVALGVALVVEPREPVPRVPAALGVAFAAGWMALAIVRFHAFDREAAAPRAVLAQLEPGRRLLLLSDDARSDAVDWFPYLHFEQWYVATRGGLADFSFAEFLDNRFRYRHPPPLPFGIEWEPWRFNWAKNGGDRYDYVLVRRGANSTWNPFAGPGIHVESVVRSGTWELFRVLR
jgi:hypothetical protein